VAGELDLAEAEAVARRLDVSLDCGICLACLSFVSMAIDEGDRRAIATETRRLTPDLWAEGLAEPLLDAARRARAEGVPGAAAALADLEERGARSRVARAVVRRLAEKLSVRVRFLARAHEQARTEGVRPELN
jgi:hypothetical protein